MAAKKKRAVAPPEPPEPAPERCPRCAGPVALLPRSPTGLNVWRCPPCRAIGHGARVVGDAVPDGLRPSPRRGPVHEGHQFIRRPRRSRPTEQ